MVKTATVPPAHTGTANPRRTTLVHLKDAKGLTTTRGPVPARPLPERTANPRRTVLHQAPVGQAR